MNECVQLPKMVEYILVPMLIRTSKGADEGIHDINLCIHTGELVVLTGESGCGKTTLIRVLSGLCPQFYAGALE